MEAIISWVIGYTKDMFGPVTQFKFQCLVNQHVQYIVVGIFVDGHICSCFWCNIIVKVVFLKEILCMTYRMPADQSISVHGVVAFMLCANLFLSL